MSGAARRVLAYAAAAALVERGIPAVTGIPIVTRRLPPAARTGHLPPVVALTFDDGPHPRGTPAILDLLAEYGATATFFVIAEQVYRYPGLCRRMVADGHEIAVHGWDHRCLTRVGPVDTYRSIASAAALVADTAGVPPTRFRPPYGVASLPALAVCRRLGLAPTWWTAWGRDWDRRATATSVHDRVLAAAGRNRRPTVLLHDSDSYGTDGSWRVTIAATRTLLRTWRRDGIPVRSLRDAARSGPARPLR